MPDPTRRTQANILIMLENSRRIAKMKRRTKQKNSLDKLARRKSRQQ